MNPFEDPIVKSSDDMKLYSCKFCGTQEKRIHLNCFNVCNCLQSMIEFNDNKFYIYNSKKENNESDNRIQLT